MDNLKISIRPSTVDDLAQIQKIFVETILTICKDDYSPEQIQAWTSSVENTERWLEKLNSQYFVVAEVPGQIVGFASLENDNHIDLLFVHKDFQRQGIANKLYSEIAEEALKKKATTLNSNVSQTARPFFENKGFKIIKRNTKLIMGVEIFNYKMAKPF
ncbi:GNAT family N-acetyltransferase [Lunatibacter salilacus]|uniref:GNAT family N-acetyltransferase n=1 Tax=Lunatibacter salilacus TaxID=2483804 RepID=UPI00131B5CB6|nr:GNAT family N-acetyltransferase [Lunatibacter salilacus]